MRRRIDTCKDRRTIIKDGFDLGEKD